MSKLGLRRVLSLALLVLVIGLVTAPPAQGQADAAGWVIFNPETMQVLYFTTLAAAEAYMNNFNFYHLFTTQITRIYTTAAWAEMIAYWEGRVAAGQAAAAVDAAAAAGIGAGTVAAVGSFVVIAIAGGTIIYYGYVANQNGCSVGDFCWQTITNYPSYFWPWQWTW
jgi:hypothetical protein